MIVNCRRFVESITAAQEGALPAWEHRHFEEHRAVCGPCRRYLEGLEATVELLHELPPAPAPTAMREALLARFRRKDGDPGT